jgi:hypothetical protein
MAAPKRHFLESSSAANLQLRAVTLGRPKGSLTTPTIRQENHMFVFTILALL